ncbi:unnamed protein product [Thelazia callipaeda]|uniref:WEB family protein n=1 Tax=Thelazia callipaeda TaxID=103827 RepID=A0A0N5DB12_THECL|nr:unnamed protein product [Thelazia callipaeda]
MASSEESLKELCEQYDRDIAETEMDITINKKLLDMIETDCKSTEQQMLAIERRTEALKKQLETVDANIDKLVISVSSQNEKVDKLYHRQQQVAHEICNARHSLQSAQRVALSNMETLQSIEEEAVKYLGNDFNASSLGSVASKLQDCQKVCGAHINQSADIVTTLMSALDDINALENIEKNIEELTMKAAILEARNKEADTLCLMWREKLFKLEADQKKAKELKAAASDKFEQCKKRTADLKRRIDDSINEDNSLSETLNFKKLEINENMERLSKKYADLEAVQEKIEMIRENLFDEDRALKLEQESHDQKMQQIKDNGEKEIFAANSALMALLGSKTKIFDELAEMEAMKSGCANKEQMLEERTSLLAQMKSINERIMEIRRKINNEEENIIKKAKKMEPKIGASNKGKGLCSQKSNAAKRKKCGGDDKQATENADGAGNQNSYEIGSPENEEQNLVSVIPQEQEIRSPFMQYMTFRKSNKAGISKWKKNDVQSTAKNAQIDSHASVNSTLKSGQSKKGKIIRKKQEMDRKSPHLTSALFGSDISASTIQPVCASTPMRDNKCESTRIDDCTAKSNKSGSKSNQKTRGRPRGQKNPTGSGKIAKETDVFDFSSDSV